MQRLFHLLFIFLIATLSFFQKAEAVPELAGTVSQKIEVGITGFHPPRHLVIEAIKWNIFQNAEIKKGAFLVFEEGKLENIKAPYPGKTKTVYLPVKIEGQGYKPYKTTVEILIKNEIIEFSKAGFLKPLEVKRILISLDLWEVPANKRPPPKKQGVDRFIDYSRDEDPGWEMYCQDPIYEDNFRKASLVS